MSLNRLPSCIFIKHYSLKWDELISPVPLSQAKKSQILAVGGVSPLKNTLPFVSISPCDSVYPVNKCQLHRIPITQVSVCVFTPINSSLLVPAEVMMARLWPGAWCLCVFGFFFFSIFNLFLCSLVSSKISSLEP